MRRVHATNYCTSSSLSAKGYHAHFHHHMTELKADPDSLVQKIFTSQANAWQTDLAASVCLFKTALRKEGQEQSNLGEIRFIVSPRNQRASKHLEQYWTRVMDLSVHSIPRISSSRENLPPFLT